MRQNGVEKEKNMAGYGAAAAVAAPGVAAPGEMVLC